MRILNQTDFHAAPVVGRMGFPAHSLTIAVKALYDLVPGRMAELLDDELAFPTGEIPAVEDDEEHTEIRHASDLDYFKPKADVMLVGKCHPPGGEPVTRCRVTFRVGDMQRQLIVFGNREWKSGIFSMKMSDPEPFTEMPLDYSHAFGGPKIAENPVGVGHKPMTLEDGTRVHRVPNIEDPKQLIMSGGDKPRPACFGPIFREWQPRASMIGTYKGAWQKTRWPWLPEDFDFNHFNAAPEPQQIEGYLRGDEEVFLEHIHPEQSEFTTKLPGVRVRCFLHELPAGMAPPPKRKKERAAWTPPPREQMNFREIDMKLDTLWIDAEAGMASLVWRGHAPVRDQEYGEVLHLFILSEPLDQAPADVAACRAKFWLALDEDEGVAKESEGEDESSADEDAAAQAGDAAEGTEGGDGEDAEETDEEMEELKKIQDESDAKLRADLEKLGIDPDNPPPPPTPEERATARAFFVEKGMDDVVALLDEAERAESGQEEEEASEPPAEPWTRDRVEAKYAEDADLSGLDLQKLDLSELMLDGANLSETNLTGANLRGVSLTKAILTEAKLTRANLTGANLTEAQCSKADFEGAILSEAVLEEADFSEAQAVRANFAKAKMPGATFEGANLQQAIFTHVQGKDASFVEADLTEAVLREAAFNTSDFNKAVLDRADARDASFVATEFGEVRAVEASFLGATMTELRAADAFDLSRANFSQIQAADSVWSQATLTGANFSHAMLDGADFTDSDLEGANLSAARLRTAKFAKANLTDALLVQADAFEAVFEKAVMTGSDISGANMYAAEFLDTVFEVQRADGTNFKMTKVLAD